MILFCFAGIVFPSFKTSVVIVLSAQQEAALGKGTAASHF